MKVTIALDDTQREKLIDLLWQSLKSDSVDNFNDRRRTGYGTKTKQGLIACIERVINENN